MNNRGKKTTPKAMSDGRITRGPGTIEQRIASLRKKLKEPEIKMAEELASKTAGELPGVKAYRVLQLAFYLTKHSKEEQKKARLLERYKRGYEKLSGKKLS